MYIPITIITFVILVAACLIGDHFRKEKKAEEIRQQELADKEKKKEIEMQKMREKEKDIYIIQSILKANNSPRPSSESELIYNLVFDDQSVYWEADFPKFSHFDNIECKEEEGAVITLPREKAWERCVLYYLHQKEIEELLLKTVKKLYPKCDTDGLMYRNAKYDIIISYNNIPPSEKEMLQIVKKWAFWFK